MTNTQNSTVSRDYALNMSLIVFLGLRRSPDPFAVQDWLETLDDQAIELIEQGAQEIVEAVELPKFSRQQHQDIAGVTVAIVGAEAGATISKETAIQNLYVFVTRLMLAACAERLRRRDWVTIQRKISLTSRAPFDVIFTDEGLRETATATDRRTESLRKFKSQLH